MRCPGMKPDGQPLNIVFGLVLFFSDCFEQIRTCFGLVFRGWDKEAGWDFSAGKGQDGTLYYIVIIM